MARAAEGADLLDRSFAVQTRRVLGPLVEDRRVAGGLPVEILLGRLSRWSCRSSPRWAGEGTSVRPRRSRVSVAWGQARPDQDGREVFAADADHASFVDEKRIDRLAIPLPTNVENLMDTLGGDVPVGLRYDERVCHGPREEHTFGRLDYDSRLRCDSMRSRATCRDVRAAGLETPTEGS
jgi:hypothetical protein